MLQFAQWEWHGNLILLNGHYGKIPIFRAIESLKYEWLFLGDSGELNSIADGSGPDNVGTKA